MKKAMMIVLFLTAACSAGGTVSTDLAEQDGSGGLLPDNGGGGGAGDVGGLWGDGKGTDGAPYVPKPGEFGAPCTSNEDCDSGFCIEGLDGYVCTMLCLEECPVGYDCVGVHIGADLVFICVPMVDRSCEPCSSDLQCSSGRCIKLGSAQYCLMPCQEGGCKESYSCQKVQVGTALESLCMPQSGTCECGPSSIGLEKACKQKSGTNVCYGIQFCEEEGWGGCELPAEICDGKDNDCNGVLDDDMLNPQNGKYDTDAHCGVCNNSCLAMTAANSAGKCNAAGPVPTCNWSCHQGYFDVNDNPTDGCECKWLSSVDDPDVDGDANCDGMEGVAGEGFFVAKNGDDNNPGTREEPFFSIQHGILTAEQEGKGALYVATGVYSESVELVAGVSLYGGYSVDFEKRHIGAYQTAIMGLPFLAELPGAVNAIDIQGIPTVFSGFHVFGGDAIEASGSSYGIYVKNCDGSLHLVNNTVIAGNGRDGERGADGQDGSNGLNGTAGKAAYDILHESCVEADWNKPGTGGSKSCGGASVAGGNGGTGICPDYDETGSQPKSDPLNQTHKESEWGKDGKGAAAGKGGEPGYDGLLWSGASNCGVCNVPKTPDGGKFLQSLGETGGEGADGSDGTIGTGCTGAGGETVNGLWSGKVGSGGANGTHGSGGGGGGAGGGVETIGCQNASLNKYTDIGGSGGGGGSGGCLGAGAAGGTPGGASFAIFVTGAADAVSVPVLKGNFVQTGFGGWGGDGGTGGVGGTGGKGAGGGGPGEDAGSAWCADAGGAGGNGGRGGHGGGGGGGCGGPSFGIYLAGPKAALAAAFKEQNQFSLVGTPGQGGKGGKSMGNAGTAGFTGATGETNF